MLNKHILYVKISIISISCLATTPLLILTIYIHLYRAVVLSRSYLYSVYTYKLTMRTHIITDCTSTYSIDALRQAGTGYISKGILRYRILVRKIELEIWNSVMLKMSKSGKSVEIEVAIDQTLEDRQRVRTLSFPEGRIPNLSHHHLPHSRPAPFLAQSSPWPPLQARRSRKISLPNWSRSLRTRYVSTIGGGQ
jgi:hypothetical protein